MRNPLALLCVLVIFPGETILAAEDRRIEEILVTAQRIEENPRTVPIAVSAFTDAMIKDRQIIGIGDLQINVRNLTHTPDNFGGSKVTIRGIGDGSTGLVARSIASPGAPIHVNGVSVLVNLNTLEFYAVDRVEVMRGPQGTLYGRSATAGAINVVTRRPDFDGMGGYVDLEYGDYDHTRAKGALNIAINDQLAFRAAGMYLERDGYIENHAAGEIPGINDDLDGRDVDTERLTGEWRPADNVNLWVM